MERLIIRYQGRIYNVILRICGNSDDAAELTQETFVKVIENIERFQGRGGFYTWAFRIAVNLTLSYCKRAARIRPWSIDDSTQEGPDGQVLKDFLCDQRVPEASELAENRELCELAVKAIGLLSEDHRAVVVLRDLEGMSYAEIAQVLDVETGTVKSRLSRARGELRRVLEEMIR
jgi:RNA polymerase sigma-70 factor (ECF subfamily)